VASVLCTPGRAAVDTPPATLAAPGADPARLVAEGNRAYTDGDIGTACTRYEEARRAGGDDPLLDYNLGNAYARQGHLGKAIASYLRAQRRDPRDPDLRTNLAWVRSHTRDLELGGGKLPPVIAQLDAAVHLLDLDEWSLLTLALVWIVAAVLALVWWRGALGDALRRALLVGAGLLVLVSVVTALRWYDERVRDVAVVTADEVEVRSGPATTFPVVFRVHDGLTLSIRGARDTWARIGLGGDWVGWVPQADLERVRQTGR
jgi:tetratricopeptide (TPR) repeat protein